MLYIGLGLRTQVSVGTFSAIVRYFWVIKEDRSKDFTVLLPSAAFMVLLSFFSKFFTFNHAPIYLDCRFDQFNVFSCEEAALEVLMYVCLSVCFKL